MPNYVQNKITFASDFGSEMMQKVLSAVLRDNDTKPNPPNTCASALSLEERCRRSMVHFDFNSLIPMPAGLNIEASTDAEGGQLLYEAYRNLPDILARRIAKAKIFEDIFVRGSENDVRKQYDAIFEQLAYIETVQNNPVFAAETARKLNSLYLPVISNFETHSWASPLLPEINYFAEISSMSTVWNSYIKDRMKQTLKITVFSPLSIQCFLRTEEGKRLFALGKQRSENVQKYGYPDWYEWNIANWGTKWNASDTFVDWDARQIIFRTAWAAPEPVMRTLQKAFPNAEFEWLYADEDIGYNTGIATSKDGEFAFTEFENCSQEAYEAYVGCWGESECMDKDAVGKWIHYSCGTCPHPC